MRHSFLVAAVALVGSALLPGCARNRPCRPCCVRQAPPSVASAPVPTALSASPTSPPVAAPSWDREAARREVLAAALDVFDKDPDTGRQQQVLVVVDDTLRPRRSYDAGHVPPSSRAADMAPLPDGRKVYRQRMEALAAGTFEDWVTHTTPTPAPKDLVATLPIEWFSEADWDALTATSGSRWPAFRRRFPNAWGRVHLSDVGFSPSHDQALLQESHDYDTCSAGSWLLLQRKDDRWMVVDRASMFIACGCGAPSPVITPSD